MIFDRDQGERELSRQAVPRAKVQRSIALSLLGKSGEMALLLVEQYFDFAHELADRIAVMDRGEIVMDEAASMIDAVMVRRKISV